MAGEKKREKKREKKSGAKKAFITRRKAMQKLQVSLKDFRRLCILKGIYPVEPKKLSKVNNGSGVNKTFYLLSDIQYLSHEPILWKLWELKTFMKRISKARGREDREKLSLIRENKPFYKLDHIVKERYPQFVDALRDLDDALSMCFLYSRFSKTSALPLELIEISRRLSVEFMHYVIETKSLRKVFVSIKGYYYQADIKGQTITWVVPHHFNIGNYHDVDFKVMRTFNEFYITLLGFVVYKLYADSNLYYPPKVLMSSENVCNEESNDDLTEEVAALNQPILKNQVTVEDEQIPDEFNEPELNDKNSLSFHEMVKLQRLFGNLKFFLNREVPRESLVFVIRSFGGTVSWDKTMFSGATYDESDESITHQIVDRDNVANKYLTRYYVQPQWVFDCVNARRLLPVEDYFIGVTLPPHLSPFVEEKEGDYIPPEKIAMNEGKSLRVEPSDESEDISDESGEEETKVLEPEPIESGMTVKAGKAVKERTRPVELEEKRLAEMMIPKKKKRLYDKIMFGKKRKLKDVNKLKEKRKSFEADLKQKKKQKNM